MLLLYLVPYDNLEYDIYIYIPLCFYFIAYRMTISKWIFTFTFHYASTLSTMTPANLGVDIRFTFHYASTLSVRLHDKGGAWKHLHSTMLLLYRQHPPEIVHRIDHLHSTMLLLYLVLRLSVSMHRLNLHSTMLLLYLRPVLFPPDVIKYLHSTMLLLYRRTNNAINKGFNLIYIPLCFYFIWRSRNRIVIISCIYIPLCFYFIPSPFSPSTFFNTVILFVYPLSA